MAWYGIVGLIAAICIAVFNGPQLIQVIKTKNTNGMSVWMLLLLIVGNLFFALNGIGVLLDTAKIPELAGRLSAGLPLFLANVVALTISVILMVFKLRSLYWAKKFDVTEKEFCENYESYKTKRKMLKAEKHAHKDTPSNVG
ncbi:MAG: SemiSWEET family sugar transporter [Mycoplasmoidaceae bacterium]